MEQRTPPKTATSLFVKEGRLRPAWRAICYTVVMVVAMFAIQIPLAIAVLVAIALGIVDQSGVMELDSYVPILFLATMANLVIIFPLTYLFRRFLDGDTVLNLGLHMRPGWLRELFAGLVLGTVLMGLVFLFEWGVGWLTIEAFSWQVQSPVFALATLLSYLLICVAVALYEELAFRGYILQNLRGDWGVVAAVLVSSILFAILHAINPNLTLLALPNIFLAGALLAACYLATRSLWLAIAFHFSWNFVQGPVLSFPLSGMPTTGLLVTRVEGNPLITGGAFGPEGGLLGSGVILLGLVIIWAWHRRAGAG